MIKRCIVVALLLGGLLAAGSPAGAGGYVFSCGFVLDPPIVPAGAETVDVAGAGFTPGGTADFYIAPVADPTSKVFMGTLSVDNDPDGNIAGTLTIPTQFRDDGEYEISTECPDGNVATNILIVGAGVPSTLVPVALPATGSDSTMGLVRVGVVLLAAGALALIVVRRRSGAAARTSV